MSILHFPYSDPSTVPSLVPPHVASRPHALPHGMNDFLCQLLEVKKRQLCPLLPVPLVQPRVSELSLIYKRIKELNLELELELVLAK